jgi:hypothetical protein
LDGTTTPSDWSPPSAAIPVDPAASPEQRFALKVLQPAVLLVLQEREQQAKASAFP